MKHSEETKRKISEKRKKYLRENPDKHPWKNNKKFTSIPCEYFKSILRLNNIKYESEFSPQIEDRFFSIDIAILDKKIAIEINGNQHYQSNGQLKNYYQKRHDLLEENGWIVYEVYYLDCYRPQKTNQLISAIKHCKKINNQPIQRKKNKRYCIDCGKNINIRSTRCINCNAKQNEKIKWPSKEELEIIIWQKPKIQIAKELGVSDKALIKRLNKLKIKQPPKKYFS